MPSKELESKSNTELKELCSEKGLAVGGGKDERVARLIEDCNLQLGPNHSYLLLFHGFVSGF